MSPDKGEQWQNERTPIRRGQVLGSTEETIAFLWWTSSAAKELQPSTAPAMAFLLVAAKTYIVLVSARCIVAN